VSDIWTILDIAPVRDRDAIRRAYARRLKKTNPEDDAQAFAELRAAYEEALASLDWDWEWDARAPNEAPALPGEGAPESLIAAPETVFKEIAAQPPRDHSGELQGRLAALEHMLSSGQAASPQEIETALADLLASPAMGAVTAQVDTELRLLEIILDNIPRSDPLVRPGMNAFGWTRAGVISRRDQLVDAVLDRDSDIGFRKGISSPGPRLYAAYQALSGPITRTARWRAWLSPTLDQDVRTLFREIDTRRPSLAADLDPEAYAWWRARQARPGLSAWMIWLMACAPLLAGVIGGMAHGSAFIGLAVWAGVQAGALLIGALYAFAYARPRDWWLSNWAWRAPMIARLGWAPASWALLLVAPLLPATPWSLALAGLAALLIMNWCLITRTPDGRESKMPWPVRAVINEMFVIIWWVMLSLDASIDMTPPVQIAIAAAITVSMFGAFSLLDFWYGEIGEPGRRAGFVVLLAAFSMAAFLLFQHIKQPAGMPLQTATFITALVMALRAPAVALEEFSFRIRLYTIWPSFMFGRSLLEAAGGEWLVVGGIWMLAGAMVTLVVTGFQVVPRLSRAR